MHAEFRVGESSILPPTGKATDARVQAMLFLFWRQMMSRLNDCSRLSLPTAGSLSP